MKLLMMFLLLHTIVVIKAAPIGSNTARRTSIAESSGFFLYGQLFFEYARVWKHGRRIGDQHNDCADRDLADGTYSNQSIIQRLHVQNFQHRNLSEIIYGWDNPSDFFCGNSTYRCQRAYLFCRQMYKKVRAQELWLLGKTLLFTAKHCIF